MKKLIGGFLTICLILCISLISLNFNNENDPKARVSETSAQKNTTIEEQEKSERELLEENLDVKDINIGKLRVNEEFTTK